MLKVLVLSLIFGMCVVMGVVKKQELLRRRSELEDVIRFAEFAKGEILYKNSTLDKIICNSVNPGHLISELAGNSEPRFLERYEKVKNRYLNTSALKSDDFRCLDTMFELLGKTDCADQVKLLENIISELKIKREDSEYEYEKRGGLYVKMGIAIGCFSVMICI